MHWYGGSIAEAVTLSKQRNAIFVVFVEGDNDLSAELAAVIDDAAVLKRLSDQTNFLAVKLKSGSPNYTHFAQIYQFVPVPSLFFIGRNGTPLEVVCAGVAADNLAARIDRILEEHHNEKRASGQPSMQPSTSSQNVREQTVNLLQSEAAASVPKPESSQSRPVEEPESGPAPKIQKTEHHEVTKSGQEYEVVCDGDVCVRKPKVTKLDEPGTSQSQPATAATAVPMETEPTAEDSTAVMEEKLERAKVLIEARRREKAEKEKESEKQKELDRRSQGQSAAELKKWQAEQELKQIQEERKREKLENSLARQRILDQIAQDRAERRARDNQPPQPLAQAAPPAQHAATSGDAAAQVRIQFKLPDGGSHTAHFDADGTLADVHQYIADNLRMARSSFSLWTAFPRRELTEAGATLRGLELAPSAALLVLPRRPPATVAAPAPVTSIIAIFTQFITSFILAPTQQLYAWLRARLLPPPPPPRAPPPRPAPRASPPPGVRRRGNIHRLPGDGGEEDDNNTWNGNSTQQM